MERLKTEKAESERKKNTFFHLLNKNKNKASSIDNGILSETFRKL